MLRRDATGAITPAFWKAWYSTRIWREIRADQLARFPFCAECERDGRVTLANTCDHIEPHKGDWAKFIGGPFQSLCGACHSSIKQAEEKRAARDARLGSAESSRPIIRVGRGEG